MGRPKNSEARDTRQDILNAALELFADTGFFGTGLREIARAVGVRESAIYHHFPNKDAILEALMTESGDDGKKNIAQVAALADTLDLQTLFERWATGALEQFATLRERKRFRILMSDGLRLSSCGRLNFMEKAGSPREHSIQLMTSLVEAGRLRAGDPALFALEFFAPLMMWRQMQSIWPEHPWVADYRSFAKAHVDHFLYSVRPERPKEPAPG